MIDENLMPDRDVDLRSVGGLIFIEETHSYFNADGLKYKGMTTFLSKFIKDKFNATNTARYKSIKDVLSKTSFTKIKSRAGGWDKVHLFYDVICTTKVELKPLLEERTQHYLDTWEQQTIKGSLEHDRREKDIIKNGFNWNGKHYPYLDKNITEITKDDVGIIPEIMVWEHNSKICGLADIFIIDKGVIHILDFKTNKKIEKSGFMGKKMLRPFNYQQDCNFAKYSAQLHGYMKMAVDLTGFKRGECVIISTKNEEYGRSEDIYMDCLDLSKEIEIAFNEYV